MPASRRPMWTRSCSAISTPGSRSRILPPRWFCRPRPTCASSARRGSRMPARPVRRRSIRACARSRRKAARIVLVVGVEQMTTTPGPEIGRNLLKASYVKDEANIEGGFAGIFGKIANAYFQKYGDQSDALAMIAAKNHKNGVGNPYAQLRKDLGFEFCRTREREEPVRRGAAEAHRLLAGVRRRGRGGARRRRDGAADEQGDRVPRRAACADFLPMAKRDILKFEGCTQAWQRALAQAGIALDRSLVRRDARLLHGRGADRIRGDGTGAGGAGRARHRGGNGRRRTASCRSIRRAG